MKPTRYSRTTVLAAFSAALCGGTLFGGCETILKDALVSGTKDFVINGVLPSLVPVGLMTGDTTQAAE